MWIFLNNAFLSIVKPSKFDKGIDPDKFLKVRARCRGHIENVFQREDPSVCKIKVIETKQADYRFRAFIDRDVVLYEIAKSILNIGYENFKDSIPEKEHAYHTALLRVWSTMFTFQDNMEHKPWAISGNPSFAPKPTNGRKKSSKRP